MEQLNAQLIIQHKWQEDYMQQARENYKKTYTEVYTANSGLREPGVVTGNSTGDGTSYDGSSTNLGYMSTVTGDNTKAMQVQQNLKKHCKTNIMR